LAEPAPNSNSDFQKIYGWIGPRNRHSKRNGAQTTQFIAQRDRFRPKNHAFMDGH